MNKDLRDLLFWLAVSLFIAIPSIALRAEAQQRTETEPDYVHYVIDKAPSLNLVAHVFPPFQKKHNGRMVGPFMEIMRLICEEAKVSCHIRMGAFKDVYPKAMSGEVDIIFSFLLEGDKERSDLFLLSESIVLTTYAFFVTSTSHWQWTGDPKELQDRTVGVYGPSGTAIVAKRVTSLNSTAKLIIEDSNLKVFQNLIIGKYGQQASIVANKDVGLDFLKSANIYGPKPAGDIEAATFGFGFSRKSINIHLAPRMLEALTRLKERGVIQPVLREHGLVPAR